MVSPEFEKYLGMQKMKSSIYKTEIFSVLTTRHV